MLKAKGREGEIENRGKWKKRETECQVREREIGKSEARMEVHITEGERKMVIE